MNRILTVALLSLLVSGCSGSGTTIARDDADSYSADSEETLAEVFSDVIPDAGGMDSGEDIPVEPLDAGADTTPLACLPGEGCFGDKCNENGDCLSGWCVEHLGEAVCTQACQEECPAGWTCRQVTGTGPDLTFICVSDFANLCRPCAAAADCKGVGGVEDVCVDYGPEGSFCGGACEFEEDCPWGFSCADVFTVNGVATKQCVADAGVCPCTGKSVALALSTPCSLENEFGVCTGQRVCTEDGLSDCDAAIPAEESCNGIDDDCDGDVDEGKVVGGDTVNLCDDENDCTADTCLGEEGCSHELLTQGECIDGDACTVGDHCEEGVCVGLPIVCDDGNPCTDDICDGLGGCTAEHNTEPCDDQDPCTVADTCSNGECVGYGIDCDCQVDEDCVALEDGDPCNGTLYCDTSKQPYLCQVDLETIVSCPAPEGPDAICLASICNAVTGECDMVPANEGYACDDGNPCTVGDACVEGTCEGAVPALCKDDNPCTDDGCDPESGCVYTNNSLPCNDGNPCTVGDICADGLCVGSESLECDDGNVCTDDFCESDQGCVHQPNLAACDDGNACTTGDSCVGGSCGFDNFVDCDDGNVCTDDSCDPLAGCQYAMNSKACDDGNPCTAGDLCSQGQCLGTEVVVCDDGNPCTDDLCAPEGGCVYTPNVSPCDDGNPCTTGDVCTLGQCTGAGQLDCDDGNACTSDSCDPAVGCHHEAAPGDCDDGNACTSGDTCQGGTCIGDDVVPCDDQNPCTTDSCNPATGCVYSMNEAPCDDGDVCTTGDHCHLGECISSGALACDDSNPCTDDSCDPATGCTFTPNAAPCDDGNNCTVDDVCGGGTCQPGSAADCTDENPCTDDYCVFPTGCVHVNNTSQCNDFNACTANEFCNDGVCGGGVPIVCDDDNPCTDNACNPDTGCTFANNTAPCSDGDACTDGDLCSDGSCTPGGVLDCDDGNPCTDDSCDTESGCLHTPVPNETECGPDQWCQAGECVDTCTAVPGTQTLYYSGNIVTFTVPDCVETLVIEAYGAQGGMGSSGAGGKGARMKGEFPVTPGETLRVLVAQQPSTATSSGGHVGNSTGGGGGSFVTRQDNTPLLIAGGGGGGGLVNGGLDGTTSTGGVHGLGPGGASGGTNGSGGGADGGMNSGRAGAGLLGDGGVPPGDGGTVQVASKAFVNGGAGGPKGDHCGAGGFGGGGSGGNYGGGGGGGYSGGGGGSSNGYGGGGGGSYNAGANPDNASGIQSGDGKVVFTW